MAGLLSIAARAMFANQAALQTVGQNIANANTPGYSRQSVVLTTSPGQYTGAGFFGRGVDVQTVERAHNDFLTKEAISTKATASADTTRAEQLARLQKLFPTGNDGIGAAVSSFLNSMMDVASNPSDLSARQVVLGQAQQLASRFASAGAQLADMQTGINSDLNAGIATVNQLAQQIANVNDQIARVQGSGHAPNDLLDQRDQLISQLSEHIAVTTLPADDGTVGVFIGGGQRLVLGNKASTLTIAQDSYDPQRSVLALAEGTTARPLDAAMLTGGSLSALLQFQNKDLQDARQQLGQLAAALGTRVNEQNALGLDLSTPSGAGAPLFNVAAPRVLPSTNNQRNPSGGYVYSAQATITDATQLQASAYRLTAGSTPGTVQLVRQSDGRVFEPVNSGDTIDGFQLTFNPASLAGGDSYMIEPVGTAAADMRRTLDNPNGIAAASPLTAVSSVNNTGTATVNSVYAVNGKFATTTAPQLPLTITFGTANPDGSVNYSLSNGLTGIWKSGQPIGNQPGATPAIDLGFELSLNGVPAAGDTIKLAATVYPVSNNGNAKAFLDLQSQTFVGKQLLPNGSLTTGATPNDAYANTLSDIGSRVQGATYLSNVSTSVAADAENSRSQTSGVNLDEEASRLIQYQQAYQASAKVLQTAQSLFDEVLRIAGQ